MSLRTPQTVEKLQTALREKAKNEPRQRFYSLYDKVYRADVLRHAYNHCRTRGQGVGVDGVTYKDIEARGVEEWLRELADDLGKKTYRPQPVRRAWIPKSDGKQRPLGIPTIRDRVAQMAAILVLGPIFDADLQPEQYAYRTKRSASDAVQKVHEHLQEGLHEVVDADLSSYFDTIPHQDLMKCLARRVSDGAMLHLVKMWLEAPVEETDERGHKRRTTRNRDEGRGTPQGGVASPWLANLYMRRFILGWRGWKEAQELDARIVNYADDFVILCRHGQGERAMALMRRIMERLRLTVNETKTRLCRLPDDSFRFLSYTFGRQYSHRTGKPYMGMAPSDKSIQKIVSAIHEETERRKTWKEPAEVVGALNAKLRGWMNYFRLGTKIPAYETVIGHARRRLRRWLCRKHRVRTRAYARYSNEKLHDEWGLYLPMGVSGGLKQTWLREYRRRRTPDPRPELDQATFEALARELGFIE